MYAHRSVKRIRVTLEIPSEPLNGEESGVPDNHIVVASATDRLLYDLRATESMGTTKVYSYLVPSSPI